MTVPFSASDARVSQGLLDRILEPYKAHCRYLSAATFRHDEGRSRARGEFAIAASCYIDDTGHFNSVEFNICYNQLIYVLLGQCVIDQAHPALASLTFDEYLMRQLPDVLIHDFHSRFRRPIDTSAFEGEVVIESVKQKGGMILVKTSVSFSDTSGGYAHGNVGLAIVSRRSADASSQSDDS